MTARLRLFSLAGLAAVLLGCTGTGGPSWFRPGPAQYQQRKAERFDPYAQPDIGPDVTGARPREYDRPTAEPARSRWTIPASQ